MVHLCEWICTGEWMRASPGAGGLGAGSATTALREQGGPFKLRCCHHIGMAAQHPGHLCSPPCCSRRMQGNSQARLWPPSVYRTAAVPCTYLQQFRHWAALLILYFYSRRALPYSLNWMQQILLWCLGFQTEENRAFTRAGGIGK